MSLYALIAKKIPTKKFIPACHDLLSGVSGRASVLSLSKKVIVFKSKKRPKFKGKLVKILEEYKLPKYLKLEEIKEDIFERAPAFEEVKATIVDEIFKEKRIKGKKFNLSFYDFEYIEQDFINRLGKRIEKELKEKGIKAKYVKRKGDIEIVLIKKTKPPFSIYLGKTLTPAQRSPFPRSTSLHHGVACAGSAPHRSKSCGVA